MSTLKFNKSLKGWMWWHIPVISTLVRLRQTHQEFKASLGSHIEWKVNPNCTARPYLKEKKTLKECLFFLYQGLNVSLNLCRVY